MTSKNTNRLKRSPVRKTPLSPISWNWKRGWKCAPARCQRARENTSAARPSTLVSTSIKADRRSSTSTMPNSGGQSPSRYTRMAPSAPKGPASAKRNSVIATASSARADARPSAALKVRRRSPISTISVPARSGMTIGAIVRCCIQPLNAPAPYRPRGRSP